MDRVTSRTDPLSRAESYTYDANGNLASVTDRKSQTTSVTYDALDRPTLRTFQGGATISYTWDAGNRLTQLVDSVAGTITRTYDGVVSQEIVHPGPLCEGGCRQTVTRAKEGPRMNMHKNARTMSHSRALMAERVGRGEPIAAVARAFGCAPGRRASGFSVPAKVR